MLPPVAFKGVNLAPGRLQGAQDAAREAPGAAGLGAPAHEGNGSGPNRKRGAQLREIMRGSFKTIRPRARRKPAPRAINNKKGTSGSGAATSWKWMNSWRRRKKAARRL